MIARMWRGWAASTEAADLYEEFLRSSFLPAAYAIRGFKGASVLRRGWQRNRVHHHYPV
jgi:hypothetical protein